MNKTLKQKVEEIKVMYYDDMYKALFTKEWTNDQESLLHAVLSDMSLEELKNLIRYMSDHYLVESYEDIYFLQEYMSFRKGKGEV